MKRLIPIVLIVAAFACTTKTPPMGYKIFGNIRNASEGQVLLKQFKDGKWIVTDTALMQAGNFTFEGKIDLPEMYRIVVSDTLPFIPLFIDNHEITISASKDSLGSARISGSKAHEEYETFWGAQKVYTTKLDSLYGEYKKAKEANNKGAMDKIDSLYEKVSAEQGKATKAYVLANKASVISAYLTWSKLVHDLSTKELDSITTAFDSTVNKSLYVTMVKDYIAILKRVEIGQPAVDFTMNGMDGKPITLSSLYGKYLLVDFWASWCSPCRQENPNVVAAYAKYHKKGFDILGVSFDKNKESWAKGIKDDKLTWNHVSDLAYWDNAAGKLYGIRSIPSNILLDPKGVIIAKNLRGEDLHKKLAELLK